MNAYQIVGFLLGSLLCLSSTLAQNTDKKMHKQRVTRYVRFRVGETTAYGIVENDQVRQLSGDLFGSWSRTQTTYPLKEVELLVPTQPTKVLALAGNYKSHLGESAVPETPEVFFKVPSCLIAHGKNIVIPAGSSDVHYEAEMVIVIGKRARNVSPTEASAYVLGVTCGSGVSALDWQKNDRQW